MEAAVVAWGGASERGRGGAHLARAALALLVGLTAAQGALDAGGTLARGVRLRCAAQDAKAAVAPPPPVKEKVMAADASPHHTIDVHDGNGVARDGMGVRQKGVGVGVGVDVGVGVGVGERVRRRSAFALPRRRGSASGSGSGSTGGGDTSGDGGGNDDTAATATAELLVGAVLWLLLLVWPIVHLASNDDGGGDDDGDGDSDAERLLVLARAVVVAPAGAGLRLWLGRRNAKHPHFPRYTFVANVAAAAAAAALFVATHSAPPALDATADADAPAHLTSPLVTSPRARSWLRALSLGFCGSLSTVSTFVAEAKALRHKLPARHAWRYVIATIAAGQVVAAGFLLPYFHSLL